MAGGELPLDPALQPSAGTEEGSSIRNEDRIVFVISETTIKRKVSEGTSVCSVCYVAYLFVAVLPFTRCWKDFAVVVMLVVVCVCIPVCLPACLSVCLSVCPSVCLSVSVSVFLRIRLYLHACAYLVFNAFLCTVRCLCVCIRMCSCRGVYVWSCCRERRVGRVICRGKP